MNIVLGIDIGTTTIGVVSLDPNSDTVVYAESVANTATIPGLGVGRHEQDVAAILTIAKGLLSRAAASTRSRTAGKGRIRGVVVSGQMHGIMLVDSCNRPKSWLISWRDQRAADSATVQKVASDPDAARRCGCRLQTGYGFATLHRLISDDRHLTADLVAGATRVCGITDYIAADLSRCLVTDHSMAGSWGGLDIRRRDWDRSTLQALRIPESALPPLWASAEPIGPISAASAHDLGMDARAIVCAGIGDHQASILGCRPIENCSCVVNVGTGGQVSVLTASAEHTPELEIRPFVDDSFVVTGTSLCGGWSYQYLANFFGSIIREWTDRDLDLETLFAVMNRMGGSAAHDAGGLMVDSMFLGSRHSSRTGGFVVGIDSSNLTPSNLVRAMANGIIDELFTYYEMAGRRARRLHAAGNAVWQNPLIIEAIEQRWKLKPGIAAHRETAAYGAACLAAVRLGLANRKWMID